MANEAFALPAIALVPEIQSNSWQLSGHYLSQLCRIQWSGIGRFEFHFE
jgi:hypothetical protein